jgi:hypothetical protein
MDFGGYRDFPYPDAINYYDRNVDPETGRPRIAGATGICRTAGSYYANNAATLVRSFADPFFNLSMQGGLGMGVDPDCLKAGGAAGGVNENRWDPADYTTLLAYYADPFNPITNPGGVHLPVLYDLAGSSPQNALENHSANQQLFAFICSGTVTIAASVDGGACAWSIFNSGKPLNTATPLLPLSEVLGTAFAGEHNADAQGFFTTFVANTKGAGSILNYTPVRNLNDDFNDGIITALNGISNPAGAADLLTLDQVLTNEQRALIGCGPFFGTRCDSGVGGVLRNPLIPAQLLNYQAQGWTLGGGMDVLNTEASAILQSIPGIEGTGCRD